jgi:hypothetical protein
MQNWPKPIGYRGLSGNRCGVVSKLSSFEKLFAGRHFDREAIIRATQYLRGISEAQYERIKDPLPVQRGNVSLSNL